jgi:hypothetical protein
MPVVPYTTPAAIASYLGRTFTPEQESWATSVASGITVWIDHRTGRTWQSTGPVLDEIGTVAGSSLFLQIPPVVSIELIEQSDGAAGWLVVPATDYALTDHAHGTVTFVGGYHGEVLRADYTTSATAPPADVAMAATVLSADYLATALAPESFGLETVAVGQNDLSLHYAGASGTASASAVAALAVVDSYRKVVLA